MSDTLIKLCGLWERVRRGNTEEGHFYLAGRLGNAKILAFKNNRKQAPRTPIGTSSSPSRRGRGKTDRPPRPERVASRRTRLCASALMLWPK